MNRNGSSIIFLTVILAALISISLTLVHAARSHGETAFADGVFTLACDSVLGMYDYDIYKDYGLFLLPSTDSDPSDEFNRCAGYSLDHVTDYENAIVNSSRYSVSDVEPVRQQILDYMKSVGILKNVTKRSSELNSGSNADTGTGHTLRHGPTITSLPSRSLPDKSIVAAAEALADNLKNPDAIFNKGTGKYLMDSYILGMFNNELSLSREDHFFMAEAEYIICGEFSDEDNIRKTKRAIKALRTGLNLSHIYSDPDKLAAIEAVSQTITPGVFGTVTQAGIATVWAAAEANNDILLLHEGYKVPIFKTDSSWALDLEGLISGLSENSKAIKPKKNNGRDYEDYLRILLFIKDENVKTARILDLIQINMRKNHDENFLIGECATGFSVDAVVNGRDFYYDRIY